MPLSHDVTVAKESIGFSAAHFLTLPGHVCERLHGHNYRLGATVHGPIDPTTGFVVDFAVVKDTLRRLAEGMDHRVLVPERNPALTLHEREQNLVIDYEWPGWLTLPRSHACVLPIAQTTAECLAEYLTGALWRALEDTGSTPARLIIEVEESHGQAAHCERRP